MRNRESVLAKMLDFKQPPEFDDVLKEVRRLQNREEFWPWLSERLIHDDITNLARDDAMRRFMDMASSYG